MAIKALNQGDAEFFVSTDASELPKGTDAGDAIDLDFYRIGKVRSRVLGFVRGEPRLAVDALDYLDKFVHGAKQAREEAERS